MPNYYKDKKYMDSEEENNGKVKAVYTTEASRTTYSSIERAAQKYCKPDTYTSNRTLYDSSSVKANTKKQLFQGETIVKDPYTGQKLVLTKKEAKRLYGDQWQNHLAETDHIKPLKQIFEDTKNNPWNTVEDVREAANSPDNVNVVSRKFNNAKRSKTNQEYVNDATYLKKKNVPISEKGKIQAIRDAENADISIQNALQKSAMENMVNTTHQAGVAGGRTAGNASVTMSGILNVVAVIKGEKNIDEALKDTAFDGAKGYITGYSMSGGLTLVSQSLSNSSSRFIQALYNYNVPAKVIAATITTGDILKRYGQGNITTQECLIELGERGLTLATTGYSMVLGQALIPIPVVGGIVGALVGSMATSKFYRDLIGRLQTRELEHQERLKIMEECNEIAEEAKKFRLELEKYLENYLVEYKNCFSNALADMKISFQIGDADGITEAANTITTRLGGTVRYETMDEFKDFFYSDSDDIF